MLVPLCCTSEAVRHKEFRMLLKGFSSKTLALRLKELEKGGILRRQAYNEIPPRVEYQLTPYQARTASGYVFTESNAIANTFWNSHYRDSPARLIFCCKNSKTDIRSHTGELYVESNLVIPLHRSCLCECEGC